ncbi:hypothetical protein FOFC_04123, partial [Fusarium oxysporum]
IPVTLADNSRECPTISPLPALITTEEVKQKDDDPVHAGVRSQLPGRPPQARSTGR